MTLKSVEMLQLFMRQKDFNNARLARYAGCTRQFIWQLLHEEKRSMKPQTAMNIAEALEVPLEVLFQPSAASTTGQIGRRRAA